ncbi:MAG: DUF4399 domain-containing protein [Steroidobacteraceae bacterium]|jgi:hypothetical protein
MKNLVFSFAASLLAATISIAQTHAAPRAAPTAPTAPTAPVAPVAPGAAPAGATMPATAPAPGAEVYIISPRNGAELHSPVTVLFGLKGMGVAPAAAGKIDNTGHHHLLIDTDLSAVDLHAPLPATDKIVHFGKGQTEATLTLPPGKHTLELLFADSTHRSFDPPLHSKKITITVQ